MRFRFRPLARRGVLCAVIAGVFVLGMPVAPSSAKPGYTVVPAARYRSFLLRGTNHFYVLVSVYGGDTVEVELLSPSAGALVAYRVHAQVNGDRFRARIGSLGMVSMRFEPTGPSKATNEPQGDCRGRRALIRPGVFVGRFRFRGEEGFSTASTTRATGSAIHSFREVCRGLDADPEVQRPETTLIAREREPTRHIEFRASTRIPPGGRFTEFVSVLTELKPGLTAERVVFAGGEPAPGQFTFDRESKAASVAPPSPFLGTASLSASNGSGGTWTGDLSVDFPGVGSVSLAGPASHAELIETKGGVADE